MKIQISDQDDPRRLFGLQKSETLDLTPAAEKGRGDGRNGLSGTTAVDVANKGMPDHVKPQAPQQRTTRASYQAMRAAEDGKQPEETKASNLNTLEVRDRMSAMVKDREQARAPSASTTSDSKWGKIISSGRAGPQGQTAASGKVDLAKATRQHEQQSQDRQATAASRSQTDKKELTR